MKHKPLLLPALFHVLAILAYLFLLIMIPHFHTTLDAFNTPHPKLTTFFLDSYRYFWILGTLIALSSAIYAMLTKPFKPNQLVIISTVNLGGALVTVFLAPVAMYLPLYVLSTAV